MTLKTELTNLEQKNFKSGFKKSLRELTENFKMDYKKYKKFYEDWKYYHSEFLFVALTYHHLLKALEPYLQPFVRIQFESVKVSRGRKKLDLVVLKKFSVPKPRKKEIKIKLLVAAEFKLEFGGVDLSKLIETYKNDFTKLEKEGRICDKYFVLIHMKESDKDSKKRQISELKKKIKKKYKQYRGINLFYVTPNYYLEKKL